MIGSDKQIKWAEEIRQRVLEHIERAKQPVPGSPVTETEIGHYDELRAACEAQDSAKWWIDHRHDDLGSLARDLLGEQRVREQQVERRAAMRALRART